MWIKINELMFGVSNFESYICAMKDQLQTVSNYAKSQSISTTWVYKLIKRGKLKFKIIDGIIFIKL